MDQTSAGPVGRLWEVTSDRLREDGAAEAFVAEVLPALDAMARDRGRMIVVDRRRGVMRDLTIADSTETWLAPTLVLDTVTAALRELTWSSLRGPLPFRLLLGRFTGRHPEAAPAAGMVARMGMVEGGLATSVELTSQARAYLDDVVLPMPGCVAAFLLADPDRNAVLVVTVWHDAASAAATVERSRQTFDAVVARSRAELLDVATYEVLVYDEPTAKVLA